MADPLWISHLERYCLAIGALVHSVVIMMLVLVIIGLLFPVHVARAQEQNGQNTCESSFFHAWILWYTHKPAHNLSIKRQIRFIIDLAFMSITICNRF